MEKGDDKAGKRGEGKKRVGGRHKGGGKKWDWRIGLQGLNVPMDLLRGTRGSTWHLREGEPGVQSE